MKKLIPVLTILLCFESQASFKSAFIKSMKPNNITKEVYESGKNFNYSTYFEKNWDKSDLDKVIIRSTADGGDGSILISLSDKVTELELRSLDLVQEFEKYRFARSSNITGFLKAVRDYHGFVAHIHTTIRKQGFNSENFSVELQTLIKSC